MGKHHRFTADGYHRDAMVIGKEEREVYVKSVAKAEEKFGNDSRAFRTITHWINPKKAMGSQYFWVTHLNTCLPQHQKVISLEQMDVINEADGRFFDGFYTYVPEIILRTEIPATQNEKFILEELVAQVKLENYEFSPEVPLRVSGLTLKKDENLANPYGLLLKLGDDTIISTEKISGVPCLLIYYPYYNA